MEARPQTERRLRGRLACARFVEPLEFKQQLAAMRARGQVLPHAKCGPPVKDGVEFSLNVSATQIGLSAANGLCAQRDVIEVTIRLHNRLQFAPQDRPRAEQPALYRAFRRSDHLGDLLHVHLLVMP